MCLHVSGICIELQCKRGRPQQAGLHGCCPAEPSCTTFPWSRGMLGLEARLQGLAPMQPYRGPCVYLAVQELYMLDAGSHALQLVASRPGLILRVTSSPDSRHYTVH